MQAHSITMLGTGLIGDFYTDDAPRPAGRDRVRVVYSRAAERGEAFRDRLGHRRSPRRTSRAAIEHPETDVVVVGLPNHLHEEAVALVAAGRQGGPVHEAARAQRRRGAADARGGREGRRVRRLPRGPVLHAQDAQGDQARPRGRRDRRRHVGPLAGDAPGAAQRVVLGRPADRRRRDHRPRLPLHRDHPQLRRQGEPPGRGPVRHRHAGPPDRRRGQRDRADPVRVRARSGSSRSAGRSAAGWTCATRWPAPTARSGSTTSCGPGFEMFTAGGGGGYVAEKAETSAGWLFPVGDEVSELGYVDMFSDMFDALDGGPRAAGDLLRRLCRQRDHGRVLPVGEARQPGSRSSCSSGAAARRRGSRARPRSTTATVVIKREILPDGRHKLILKDPASGDFTDRVVAGGWAGGADRPPGRHSTVVSVRNRQRSTRCTSGPVTVSVALSGSEADDVPTWIRIVPGSITRR